MGTACETPLRCRHGCGGRVRHGGLLLGNGSGGRPTGTAYIRRHPGCSKQRHVLTLPNLEEALFLERWSVPPPADWSKTDLWPGYSGPFLRRPSAAYSGDEAAGPLKAVTGTLGLLPFWANDASLPKRTYNARSETAAERPSFRDAWKRA